MTKPTKSSRSRGSEKAECCTATQIIHVWSVWKLAALKCAMVWSENFKVFSCYAAVSYCYFIDTKAVVTAIWAYKTGLG